MSVTSSNSSWISPKAEIKKSSVEGTGLLAKEDITLGAVVVVWKGEYTDAEGAKKAKSEGRLIMQWGEDLFSVEDRGDDDGYFINHSCDSNLWMKDAYTLIARKSIKAGEEITADYALWEADENFVSSWECHCGSSNCRKRVTGKDWKLKEVQESYKGHFSPLINNRLRKTEIISAIKLIGSRLEGHKVTWLIGGSGSLLVHGLNIIPNDIDLIVDPKNYEEAKTFLKDLLTGETKVDGDHLQTPFKINGFDGELLTHNIDEKLLQTVTLDSVDISVYQLQAEYEFYKKRTDKLEANKLKIELIEKALPLSAKM